MCFLKNPVFWIWFGAILFIFASLLTGFDRITIEIYLYITAISVFSIIGGIIHIVNNP